MEDSKIISQKQFGKIERLLLIKSIVEYAVRINEKKILISAFKMSGNHLKYVHNLIFSRAPDPVIFLATLADNPITAELARTTYILIDDNKKRLYMQEGKAAGAYMPYFYAECVAKAKTPEIAAIVKVAASIIYEYMEWPANKLDEYFKGIESVDEAKKAFFKICEKVFLGNLTNVDTMKETYMNVERIGNSIDRLSIVEQKNLEGNLTNSGYLKDLKSTKDYLFEAVSYYLKDDQEQLEEIVKQIGGHK